MLSLDNSWWVGIPLPLPAQAHVLSHGWLVGATSEQATGAGRLDVSRPKEEMLVAKLSPTSNNWVPSLPGQIRDYKSHPYRANLGQWWTSGEMTIGSMDGT